jgi:hypothetical protein
MKNFNESEKRLGKFDDKDWGFHGDVLLFSESEPEWFESSKKIDDGILALGEHTGHCHKLFGNFDLRENPVTKERHLRLVEPCLLKHQEHAPIEIAPGSYRIGTAKEYDHFSEEIRKVTD